MKPVDELRSFRVSVAAELVGLGSGEWMWLDAAAANSRAFWGEAGSVAASVLSPVRVDDGSKSVTKGSRADKVSAPPCAQ